MILQGLLLNLDIMALSLGGIRARRGASQLRPTQPTVFSTLSGHRGQANDGRESVVAAAQVTFPAPPSIGAHDVTPRNERSNS
ncbi:unnamed protein product [Schistocephalus solidus]|uniref:Secreted protein n=1 Tax=Schistocephalus solidus TaxID=70667 RepID=A0A183SFK7_SCHSO|nr:unnamed protein product [Schistocephalus solidus]